MAVTNNPTGTKVIPYDPNKKKKQLTAGGNGGAGAALGDASGVGIAQSNVDAARGALGIDSNPIGKALGGIADTALSAAQAVYKLPSTISSKFTSGPTPVTTPGPTVFPSGSQRLAANVQNNVNPVAPIGVSVSPNPMIATPSQPAPIASRVAPTPAVTAQTPIAPEVKREVIAPKQLGNTFTSATGGTATLSRPDGSPVFSPEKAAALQQRIMVDTSPEASAKRAESVALTEQRRLANTPSEEDQLKSQLNNELSKRFVNTGAAALLTKRLGDISTERTAGNTAALSSATDLAKNQRSILGQQANLELSAQKAIDDRNKNIVTNINTLNEAGASPSEKFRQTIQLGGPSAVNFDTFKLFHQNDPELNQLSTKSDLKAFLDKWGYPEDAQASIYDTSSLPD